VLEHIADPVPLLKQILTWLSPGGKFIVGVPNAKSFHRMVAVKMGLLESIYSLNERDLQLGHERVYDMDLLKAHLTEAGFSISHETGVFLKFLANGQIEQWFSQEMIQAFYELGKDYPELCAEILVIASN
jgi:SAM-dependent methyltransferase